MSIVPRGFQRPSATATAIIEMSTRSDHSETCRFGWKIANHNATAVATTTDDDDDEVVFTLMMNCLAFQAACPRVSDLDNHLNTRSKTGSCDDNDTQDRKSVV